MKRPSSLAIAITVGGLTERGGAGSRCWSVWTVERSWQLGSCGSCWNQTR